MLRLQEKWSQTPSFHSSRCFHRHLAGIVKSWEFLKSWAIFRFRHVQGFSKHTLQWCYEIDPINCQIACLKGCIGVCFLSLHFKMIYLRCKINWLDRFFLLPMFVLNPSKNITTDICGCYICSEVRFRKITVSGSGNSTLTFSSRMGLRFAFCCQAGCV